MVSNSQIRLQLNYLRPCCRDGLKIYSTFEVNAFFSVVFVVKHF